MLLSYHYAPVLSNDNNTTITININNTTSETHQNRISHYFREQGRFESHHQVGAYMGRRIVENQF